MFCAFALAAATALAAEHTPRLTAADVVRIASRAAARADYRLRDYKAPTVRFEVSRKDYSWTAFFEGKASYPGNHFLVWVDDRTKKTRVMPGE